MYSAQELGGGINLGKRDVTFPTITTPTGEPFNPAKSVVEMMGRDKVSTQDKAAFYEYFATVKQALAEVMKPENRHEGFAGLLKDDALTVIKEIVAQAEVKLIHSIQGPPAQLSKLIQDTSLWIKAAIASSRVDELNEVLYEIEAQLSEKLTLANKQAEVVKPKGFVALFKRALARG